MPVHPARRLVIASLLLLGAAACSDDADDAADTTTTAPAEEPTTTQAPATTTTAADELSVGAQIVFNGALDNGLPAATAECLALAVYEGLTPEQQAELDAAGESGQPVPESLAGTLEQLGAAAFASCA